MKITKRQLKRIIKEEKAKLLNEQMPGVDRQVRDLWGEPGVEEGVSRGVYATVENLLEQHAEDLQLDLSDPSIAASFAHGLRQLANDMEDV